MAKHEIFFLLDRLSKKKNFNVLVKTRWKIKLNFHLDLLPEKNHFPRRGSYISRLFLDFDLILIENEMRGFLTRVSLLTFLRLFKFSLACSNLNFPSHLNLLKKSLKNWWNLQTFRLWKAVDDWVGKFGPTAARPKDISTIQECQCIQGANQCWRHAILANYVVPPSSAKSQVYSC